MFESIEIRRVANGYIVVLRTDTDEQEYVYDSSRKALRMIKQHLDAEQTSEKI